MHKADSQKHSHTHVETQTHIYMQPPKHTDMYTCTHSQTQDANNLMYK